MDPKFADHFYIYVYICTRSFENKKVFNHLATQETSIKDHEGKVAFETWVYNTNLDDLFFFFGMILDDVTFYKNKVSEKPMQNNYSSW